MSAPLDERVAELRGLLSKATPGPWESVGSFTIGDESGPLGSFARTVDRDLAHAAVNALPDLLAALERVEALHAPMGTARVCCSVCWGDYPMTHDDWPCRTLRALSDPGRSEGGA